MAKERIDISCDADTARAIEKIVALAREYNKIGDAAHDVGEKGKKASNEWAAAVEGMVGKWTSLVGQIGLAVTGIQKYLDVKKQLRDEQFDATRVIDSGMTAYRIAQGNLSPELGLQAAERISGVAQSTNSSHEAAFSAATKLAAYGVGRGEAEGAALRELLDLQSVVGTQSKLDPSAFTQATLDALQRSRRPITGDSVRQFGSTAYGLSQRLKGFDAGEMQITGDVATYGRNAGLGLDETMAIVGSLSEAYGEGGAKKKFKSLFNDSQYTAEERVKVAQLRAQAQGMLRQSSGAYGDALAIASGSVAEQETGANTAYEASGFTPGRMSAETIKKRYFTAFRDQMGKSVLGETIERFQYGMLEHFVEPETVVRTMTIGDTGSSHDPRQNRIYEQTLTVRLQTSDGRDIPTETSAEGLNQPSGNDQSRNFGQ